MPTRPARSLYLLGVLLAGAACAPAIDADRLKEHVVSLDGSLSAVTRACQTMLDAEAGKFAQATHQEATHHLIDANYCAGFIDAVLGDTPLAGYCLPQPENRGAIARQLMEHFNRVPPDQGEQVNAAQIAHLVLKRKYPPCPAQ